MHSGDFMLITRSYACVYDSVFVDARVDFRFVEFLSGSTSVRRRNGDIDYSSTASSSRFVPRRQPRSVNHRPLGSSISSCIDVVVVQRLMAATALTSGKRRNSLITRC